MRKRKLIWIGILFIGVLPMALQAEDALRDGNRNPTLLFDQGGQPKRVSATSPLPVSVTTSGGSGTSQVNVINPSTAPVPVRVFNSTVPVILMTPVNPIPVAVSNQISSMAVTVMNPSTFSYVSVTNASLPVTVSTPLAVNLVNPSVTVLNPSTFTLASITNSILPVSISTPLSVNVLSQPSTMTVIPGQVFPVSAVGSFPITSTSPLSTQINGAIHIISTNTLSVTAPNPLPITSTVPLSVNVLELPTGKLTHVSERTGTGTFTLITPTAGKRIAIKSVTVASSASGDIDVRFASGQIIHKVYLTTHMGQPTPSTLVGGINEVVQGVASGFGGGTRMIFNILYEEQ